MKGLGWLSIAGFAFTNAWAGGGAWGGSGGELFKDLKNPWFVHNTEKVTYCIQASEESMSANKSVLSQAVRDAIQYWKKEFLKLPSNNDLGTFQLGSQIFIEGECTPQTDVRFLFGYETLSKEERDFLKDPQKYIGVTVRTDYDDVNLRGKGFVFISSDRGKNPYHNAGNLVSQAWQRPKLLTYALLHEVGHIFGFPHMGSGLMSEVFLEQMLSKNMADIFDLLPVESFVHPDEQIEICETFFPSSKFWLGSDEEYECLMLEAKFGASTWKIHSRKKKGDAPKLLGAISGINLGSILSFQGKPAVVLQLTDKQKVFSFKETGGRPFMFGALLMEYGASAVYQSAKGGLSKPVHIKVTPSSLEILGVNRNKVEPVVSYLSPLSILMFKLPTP